MINIFVKILPKPELQDQTFLKISEQGAVVEVKVVIWKTIRTNRAGQGQGQELSGEKGGNEEDEEAIRGLEHLPLQLSPHSENQDSFPF